MSVDRYARMRLQHPGIIIQSGTPPHTCLCLGCGKEWDPTPAKSGPNKGEHTEASLTRSANDHYATCPKGTR